MLQQPKQHIEGLASRAEGEAGVISSAAVCCYSCQKLKCCLWWRLQQTKQHMKGMASRAEGEAGATSSAAVYMQWS